MSDGEGTALTYEEWGSGVPKLLRDDPLWKTQAYRIAMFVADLAWHDSTKLMKDARTKSVADQLFRASSRIGARVTEGYARGSGRDRSRFYEYALGSARDARDWYCKARRVLTKKVTMHRIDLYTQLVKLLTTMIVSERRRSRFGRQERVTE
jgi:four helix bundle protein